LVTLFSLRRSTLALVVAVTAWATGCAITPQPAVDPGYAARAYTPGRVAVLPPDVFVVVDQFGDNDPAMSAALGQQVSADVVRIAEQALRARGYDVDLSSRWDGVFNPDGSMLVSAEEMGGLANGVLSFANSREGGEVGALASPRVIEPELAARFGAATQTEAVLYLNVKGAVTTPGKRTASIMAGVFFVVIVAAVVLAIAAASKGGGNNSGMGRGSGGGIPRGASVARAPTGGGWRGAPRVAPIGTPRGAPVGGMVWRGGGVVPVVPRGAPIYTGHRGPHIGVGVIVPLGGPVHTHDGSVDYDDPWFAGDELYVSMTLVSTYDGRVLWHVRDHVDREANHPEHIEEVMHAFLDTLPPALPRPASSPQARR
jgi:hypothetical protein